ncbi:hypothetical protein FGB62_257g02 [Gracilaria domingensis]|nr:hypothetical protein FGB62_257g02 [Gracilaria domingensis]
MEKVTEVKEPRKSGGKKFTFHVGDDLKGVAPGLCHNMTQNRSEYLSIDASEGIITERDRGRGFVPKSPVELINGLGVYKPSFAEVMWDSMILCGLEEAYLKEVCTDICLKQTMRLTICDVLGVRKRNAREKLFFLLGYDLIWKRAKNTTENTEELKKQVEEAQTKLAPLTEMMYSEHSASSQDLADDEQDALFGNSVAFQVLQEFRGYDVEEEYGTQADGTILLLARLDAWVYSVVKLLVTGSRRGRQRQREFSKAFGEILPACMEQLIHTAYNIVEERQSVEFTNYGRVHDECSVVENNDVREVTVGMRMPSSGKFVLELKDTFLMTT